MQTGRGREQSSSFHIYLFSNRSGPLTQLDVEIGSFCSGTSEKLPDLESVRRVFTLTEDR